MRPISKTNTINTATTAAVEVAEQPSIAQPRSPWHSPVPFLFGGLAAMLGLIFVALLILACSYWKISVRGHNSDIESENEKEGSKSSEKADKFYEEKFLVIMAGNDRPTFIATAVSSKTSSLKDEKVKKREGEKVENEEKYVKEEMGSSQQEQTQEEGDP